MYFIVISCIHVSFPNIVWNRGNNYWFQFQSGIWSLHSYSGARWHALQDRVTPYILYLGFNDSMKFKHTCGHCTKVTLEPKKVDAELILSTPSLILLGNFPAFVLVMLRRQWHNDLKVKFMLLFLPSCP